MSRHYITLYDGSYAVKGALMIESLARCSAEPPEVTVVALDDRAESMAARMVNDADVVIVPLAALEAAVPTLPAARAAHTWREYCWLLASVALRHQLAQVPAGEVVTYLDADLGFFSDPEACFRELGERSIGITPHRFAERYQSYAATSGTFNVSWVSLRNDEVGRACAEDWAASVLARCAEADCGDQRYLDAWPARYGAALHAFNSVGIGVAPWNVFDYRVENGHAVTVNEHPVVFYHYHELAYGAAPASARELRLGDFRLTLGYPLRSLDIDVFYRGYCRCYEALAAELAAC